jgi:hypothetical protein
MNWLYVSILLINGTTIYDVAVVKSKDECINKGRNVAAQAERHSPNSYWRLNLKCFILPKGTDV